MEKEFDLVGFIDQCEKLEREPDELTDREKGVLYVINRLFSEDQITRMMLDEFVFFLVTIKESNVEYQLLMYLHEVIQTLIKKFEENKGGVK